jgi:D-tyrosyl-tRNA(Tyr) deacylase
MKVIIQRVLSAQVNIDNIAHGKIGRGYLLYVCFERQDSIESIKKAVIKITNLRINEDQEQKMNLNLSQVEGSILSISQFTLSWDGKKGNRPSFENSMEPTEAKELYKHFNKSLKENGLIVESGVFAADMKVESINDGPVTFIFNF